MTPKALAPQATPSIASGFNWAIIWLALILTLKSVYLAFFVIPPADIPDESGHYAYVKDIAGGNFFPLLETATIPDDLWMPPPADAKPGSSKRINYIVQHPPLYYLVAAIPYSITQLFTEDRWYLIRATRLVSALSIGLTILVVFKILTSVGLGHTNSTLMAVSLAFVPTLSNLSAGITNDIFLLLLSAMATLYFVRFILHNRLRDAYLCALWLTLAGATKMTSWLMIAAMVAMMIFELRLPWKQGIVHAAGIGLTSVLAPLWWMGRNLVNFGDPFFIGNHSILAPTLPNATLSQMLESQPFFSHMFTHFYALFGFSGYCQTPELRHLCVGTRLTHVNNEPFFYFLLALLLVTVLTLIHCLRHAGSLISRASGTNRPPTDSPMSLQHFAAEMLDRRWLRGALTIISLLAGITVFAYGMVHLHKEPGIFHGWIVSFLAMAPWLIIPFAVVAVLTEFQARERLLYHLVLAFAFFGVMFVLQSLKAYVMVGQLRGIQGRYFYPYIPMFLAAAALVLARLRLPTPAYLWIVIGLALADIYTYVQHVIPFFESVKI